MCLSGPDTLLPKHRKKEKEMLREVLSMGNHQMPDANELVYFT